MYSAQSSGGGGPRETRVARCSLKRSCKSVDEGFTKGVEAGSGVPDLDPCFLRVARGVPVNGDWLLNQDVSDSNRNGLFIVDVPLTRASAAEIGGSDLLFEQCLRNAVRRAGAGTEEEGSKDCRKVEGAVDCTEIVLRRLGFESMLMKCRQEPLS
jgi:hypothetical protein